MDKHVREAQIMSKSALNKIIKISLLSLCVRFLCTNKWQCLHVQSDTYSLTQQVLSD